MGQEAQAAFIDIIASDDEICITHVSKYNIVIVFRDISTDVFKLPIFQKKESLGPGQETSARPVAKHGTMALYSEAPRSPASRTSQSVLGWTQMAA